MATIEGIENEINALKVELVDAKKQNDRELVILLMNQMTELQKKENLLREKEIILLNENKERKFYFRNLDFTQMPSREFKKEIRS
jgi:prophage antirepressor-like protein